MILMQWQIDEYNTRKTQLDTELAALDAVIAQYIANPSQSYMLNTGQTQQQVSKANIDSFINLRETLRSKRWDILMALNGSLGSAYFRPDF